MTSIIDPYSHIRHEIFDIRQRLRKILDAPYPDKEKYYDDYDYENEENNKYTEFTEYSSYNCFSLTGREEYEVDLTSIITRKNKVLSIIDDYEALMDKLIDAICYDFMTYHGKIIKDFEGNYVIAKRFYDQVPCEIYCGNTIEILEPCEYYNKITGQNEKGKCWKEYKLIKNGDDLCLEGYNGKIEGLIARIK